MKMEHIRRAAEAEFTKLERSWDPEDHRDWSPAVTDAAEGA